MAQNIPQTQKTKPVPRQNRKWPLWLVMVLGGCLLAGLSWFVYDRLTFQPTGVIAYECKPRGGAVDICIINADGSNYRPIVQLDREDALSPAWSPDGKRLAYITNSGLQIVDIDSGVVSEINGDNIGTSGSTLAWSPSGKEILLEAKVNDVEGLYLVSVNGEDPRLRLLFERGHSNLRSVFSTDGQWVIHVSYLDGDYAMTYRTKIDGSISEKLGKACGGIALPPQRETLACENLDSIAIYNLMDLQTPIGLIQNWSTNLSNARAPAWSPDGQFIVYFQTHWPAFMGNHSGELWIMRADGSRPTKLTNGPGDRNPAWRPQP